jgi:hypothetical protein
MQPTRFSLPPPTLCCPCPAVRALPPAPCRPRPAARALHPAARRLPPLRGACATDCHVLTMSSGTQSQMLLAGSRNNVAGGHSRPALPLTTSHSELPRGKQDFLEKMIESRFGEMSRRTLSAKWKESGLATQTFFSAERLKEVKVVSWRGIEAESQKSGGTCVRLCERECDCC